MKDMEKMPLGLNLAKLVRLQRANQVRIDPFYDASLYVFSPKDADEATGKTFPKKQKTIHAQFSTPHAPLFAEIFIFFCGCCTFIPIFKNHPEVDFKILFRIWNFGIVSDFEIRISDF